MKPVDYVVDIVMSVFIIIGVYQFYFWCQRNYVSHPREFKLSLDEAIPYRPRWVWIYSCLYYPIIVYINFVMGSPREFLHMAASFIVLLVMQMVFFVLFPVATPEHWRAHNQKRNWSERFLAFVQRFDAPTNSFPSMHTSVATLTAFHLYANVGPAVILFPLLISISCLYTKQHYIMDLPAGAVLGGVAFGFYRFIL